MVRVCLAGRGMVGGYFLEGGERLCVELVCTCSLEGDCVLIFFVLDSF